MARRRRSNTGIPGLSFSWKRALGITSAKRKIAKITGIPTTKSGRQRKLGRMMTGGCLLPILVGILAIILIIMLFG
mgnify:CR=1 FL=1